MANNAVNVLPKVYVGRTHFDTVRENGYFRSVTSGWLTLPSSQII